MSLLIVLASIILSKLTYFSVGLDLSNAPDLEKADRESAKHQKKFGKELAKVQKDKEKKKVSATAAVSSA